MDNGRNVPSPGQSTVCHPHFHRVRVVDRPDGQYCLGNGANDAGLQGNVTTLGALLRNENQVAVQRAILYAALMSPQGTLRSDFTVEDVPLVFWSGGRVIERTASVAPDHWRRVLGLLLDGLRAEAATPLSAPPLTNAQLSRVTKEAA